MDLVCLVFHHDFLNTMYDKIILILVVSELL